MGCKNGDRVASTARPQELAWQRPQFGSPRLRVLPRRKGLPTNHAQTGCLYCDEGLSRWKERRKKRPSQLRVVMPVDDGAGQGWTMHFASGALIIGPRVRMLTTIAVWNRVCPRVQHAFVALDGCSQMNRGRAPTATWYVRTVP